MEFYLKDLSDAGPMDEFRVRLQVALTQGEKHCDFHITAKHGWMATALYWRWELMRERRLRIRTILDGNVSLPALVVWTASPNRSFTENVRVSCWSKQRFIGRERDEAFLAITGAMACTDHELRDGVARRDVAEWFDGNLILGPEQLRRWYHSHS